MGLMIAIDRRIVDNVTLLRENKWDKASFANCAGLKGKTVGLLGIGAVGKEVCKRCLAFDMKVLAWDVFITKEDIEAMGATKVEKAEDIATSCDIISLHVPSVPATKKMISQRFLSLMKPTAVLINTARSDLIVDEDILARLNAVRGFYYATDVVPAEPKEKKCDFDCPMGKHPKVIATHHIGASTVQAETAIGVEAVRMVKEYGSTKKVCNCVNMAAVEKQHVLKVKYVSAVGVLGAVLVKFTEFGIKIEEMKNEVFGGRKACVSAINFTGDISKIGDLVEGVKKIPEIIDVVFVP